jgi:hypothetical protein
MGRHIRLNVDKARFRPGRRAAMDRQLADQLPPTAVLDLVTNFNFGKNTSQIGQAFTHLSNKYILCFNLIEL